MIIEKTNFTMYRGDSETITLTVKWNGEVVNLDDGDTVYLTIKINESSDTVVLQKVITVFNEGQAIIDIEPSDTVNLAARTYKYDVRWVDKTGRIRTIITPSLFTIKSEVTNIPE